jgi:hypothetical protein
VLKYCQKLNVYTRIIFLGIYVVNNDGTLFMYSGKISDNKGVSDGCGVYNSGTFVMSGGAISNNTAGCYGGGVCSWGGSFVMSGGEIFDNIAIDSGGGVYNSDGVFTMSGGEISNNWAYFNGGGVCNREGVFAMSDGVISGNNADGSWGGGVSNWDGTFTMSGGEILKNKAKSGGGVFNTGNFTMSDGEISKNGVYGRSSFVSGEGFGGGVSNWAGGLELRGGKITCNKASNGGDNVYNLGDVYYFGVRDVTLIICVSVVFVVLCAVVTVAFFMFKKRRMVPVMENLSHVC